MCVYTCISKLYIYMQVVKWRGKYQSKLVKFSRVRL